MYVWPWLAVGLLVAVLAPRQEHTTPPAQRVLEIRSYTLKSGVRDDFHTLFIRDVLPLLQRWKVDVVAYGPSLHDRDSYFLMRGFASVEEREESEALFYGSAEWRNGPREAVLAAIESYTTAVIQLDASVVEGLRRSLASQSTIGGRNIVVAPRR
jgi:hypothetical protein